VASHGASIGSILTSIIASGFSFLLAKQALKADPARTISESEKEQFPDEPYSVTRLMADLGMTEAEIFAACDLRKRQFC
jgi:hypothetical protein